VSSNEQEPWHFEVDHVASALRWAIGRSPRQADEYADRRLLREMVTELDGRDPLTFELAQDRLSALLSEMALNGEIADNAPPRHRDWVNDVAAIYFCPPRDLPEDLRRRIASETVLARLSDNVSNRARATALVLGIEPNIVRVRREPLVLDAAAAALVARLNTRRRRVIDLRLFPPVASPPPDQAGRVAADVEAVLAWAARYVADDSNPDDLRDVVDARRSQLAHEVQLTAQGNGMSAVLSGLIAALLPLVRPPGHEIGPDAGLSQALEKLVDAAISLGTATAPEDVTTEGEAAVAALDQTGGEIASIIEANAQAEGAAATVEIAGPHGQDPSEVHRWADLRSSFFRAAGSWVEADLRNHLNDFLTLYKDKLSGSASGAAGGAVVGLAGGPPWLVVMLVSVGLLRARFPWIFRPPPSEVPPDDHQDEGH